VLIHTFTSLPAEKKNNIFKELKVLFLEQVTETELVKTTALALMDITGLLPRSQKEYHHTLSYMTLLHMLFPEDPI